MSFPLKGGSTNTRNRFEIDWNEKIEFAGIRWKESNFLSVFVVRAGQFAPVNKNDVVAIQMHVELGADMAAVDQGEWVSRLKSTGDVRNQAITELREVLLRGLRVTCRDRYSNKVQAEDVVQEALMKVLDKLDTFEGRSKFTTWAMTIAVRIAISEMRRKHFKDVSMNDLLDKSMHFEPAASEDPLAEDNQQKIVLLTKLKELIETSLSEKQRDAMHSLLNGVPVEVFAEKTGSNRNAVYKLVHDARAKLRKGFEQAGYKAEDINSVFA